MLIFSKIIDVLKPLSTNETLMASIAEELELFEKDENPRERILVQRLIALLHGKEVHDAFHLNPYRWGNSPKERCENIDQYVRNKKPEVFFGAHVWDMLRSCEKRKSVIEFRM